MTKKILHSPDLPGAAKEHLIPMATETGIVLVGIKSGEAYEYGMVVYTGKELSPEMLAAKGKAIGLEVECGLCEAYLAQIPRFQISKAVGIKRGGELCLEYVRT